MCLSAYVCRDRLDFQTRPQTDKCHFIPLRAELLTRGEILKVKISFQPKKWNMVIVCANIFLFFNWKAFSVFLPGCDIFILIIMRCVKYNNLVLLLNNLIFKNIFFYVFQYKVYVCIYLFFFFFLLFDISLNYRLFGMPSSLLAQCGFGCIALPHNKSPYSCQVIYRQTAGPVV